MSQPTEFYVMNMKVGEVVVVHSYSGGYPVLTSKPLSEIRAASDRAKLPSFQP
jgi:hypothetical protein